MGGNAPNRWPNFLVLKGNGGCEAEGALFLAVGLCCDSRNELPDKQRRCHVAFGNFGSDVSILRDRKSVV